MARFGGPGSVVMLLVWALGCGDGGTGGDAGTTDVDASTTVDAGGDIDASTADHDAGGDDAGGDVDASTADDAGGDVDASATDDAGGAIDASTDDAGTTDDAGLGSDAGSTADAGGRDAGPMCTARPPTGCCYLDSQCARGSRCVGEVCADRTAGMCKPRTVEPGSCWESSDCGDGTCIGADICPCGAACLLPDRPGTCATRS